MSEDGNRLLRGIARRLRKSPDGDSEEGLLSAVLETGDKAKSEIVRLVAKEVRGYLEALELHKDLKHILTNYSLEIKASINLKELVPENADKPAKIKKKSKKLKKAKQAEETEGIEKTTEPLADEKPLEPNDEPADGGMDRPAE